MNRKCHDCRVSPGQNHLPGCDVELCALCGGQMLNDDCVYELNGISVSRMEEMHPDIYGNGPTKDMWKVYDQEVNKYGGPIPWSGEWPGFAEARKAGFFCNWVNPTTLRPLKFPKSGGRWLPCLEADPGAQPDISRLRRTMKWDKVLRTYIKS